MVKNESYSVDNANYGTAYSTKPQHKTTATTTAVMKRKNRTKR